MNQDQRRAELLERARRDNDFDLMEFLGERVDDQERFRLRTERETALQLNAPQVDPLSGMYIHPDDALALHGRVWSRNNLTRFVVDHSRGKVPVWPDSGAPMTAEDLNRLNIKTNSAGQVVTTAIRPGVGVGLGAGAGLLGGLALGAALSRPYYGYGYGPGGYGYGGYGYGYPGYPVAPVAPVIGYDPFLYDGRGGYRDRDRNGRDDREDWRRRRRRDRDGDGRPDRDWDGDGRPDRRLLLSTGRPDYMTDDEYAYYYDQLHLSEGRANKSDGQKSDGRTNNNSRGGRSADARRNRNNDRETRRLNDADVFDATLMSTAHPAATQRERSDPLV